MKTTNVNFLRKDGTNLMITMPVIEIMDDRYRFNKEEAEKVPAVYLFRHEHQHSRLDLSLLDDHLLISFDKHDQLVGVTYCSKSGEGPFEVHNKQRTFMLVRRDQTLDPTEIESINYV
jgi:hypothetical protein